MPITTPSQRGKHKLKTVGLILAVLLLSPILLEFLLRAVLGLGHRILFVTDPACGYLPRPSQHVRRFFVRTEINSHGMRSPDFPIPKPKGTLRLMFVGDSITYGTTRVDQSKIFTALVGSELPQKLRRPVDELNASVSGWAIANELGYLKSRGTFGSDYVFVVLNSGDMAQQSSSIEDMGSVTPTRNELALAELFRRLPELVRFEAGHRDPGTTVSVDRAGEEMNAKRLTQIAAAVVAQGSHLIVLFIPFRGFIPSYAASSAPDSLRGWAQSSAVRLIDLTNTVSRYPADSISLPDQVHYNTEGNRILASAIEEQIESLL